MVSKLQSRNLMRPYLVIPKLIEQPTWGGDYIAKSKNWQNRPDLVGKKIGQSYELFSGSNLSLCDSSEDPNFVGELTDRDAVQVQTVVPNSVSLQHLLQTAPKDTLGANILAERGENINLLIKYTQALGNSFQVHLRDGHSDPYWKPKLEAWYYFEPGILTLGVKKDVDWQEYQAAVTAVDAGMREIGQEVMFGELSLENAQAKVQSLLQSYDPWQFVNTVEVGKNELVDLTNGGIHHSWEEDTERFPLGNVLYEVQNEAMDDVSTLRSFDKGKLGSDGSPRDVHIEDYFRLIDRSSEANDPQTHVSRPNALETEDAYGVQPLLKSNYYSLDKLVLRGEGAIYSEQISQFKHLFIQSGRVVVAAEKGEIKVGAGHACFIPAGVSKYEIRSTATSTTMLITS